MRVGALRPRVAGALHHGAVAREQLSGDTVDRRCDVYGMGVMLYQMGVSAMLFFAFLIAGPANPWGAVSPVPNSRLGGYRIQRRWPTAVLFAPGSSM